MTNGEFSGLVAVVTGGASDIGLATARLLAEHGAAVACLDVATDDLREFFPVRCDVGTDESVRAAIAAVVERFGRIDIVVNNAGIGAQGTIEENDDAEWLRVLNVNVLGVARVTRAALPHLRRSPHAAVVNVCSIVRWTGLPEGAVYSARRERCRR
jgi:2-keto-3-deoxy-L-fuconate dehydrogenase